LTVFRIYFFGIPGNIKSYGTGAFYSLFALATFLLSFSKVTSIVSLAGWSPPNRDTLLIPPAAVQHIRHDGYITICAIAFYSGQCSYYEIITSNKADILSQNVLMYPSSVIDDILDITEPAKKVSLLNYTKKY